MSDHRSFRIGAIKRAGWIVLLGLAAVSSAGAAGWTSTSATPWGATVLAIQTQDGGSTNGVTTIWLSSTGATNVNGCSLYTDTTTGSIPGVQFVMAHPINSAITDIQKSQIAELQVAASAGKQVRLYAGGCSSGGTSGYNAVSAVWVKY